MSIFRRRTLLTCILIGTLSFLISASGLLYSAIQCVARPAVETTSSASFHHKIATQSPRAQERFDEGLLNAYGFNHEAAAQAFREAAQLDSQCAMCYWGIALVLGPNINASMTTAAGPEAWHALQQAIVLSKRAPAHEQAYIRALSKRYTATPVSDRHALDVAYANAMRQVARQYPDDADAATLFAEALMDTTAWNYWKHGKPKSETVEILAILKSVLRQAPNHPGANHFYIHAVESSPQPEQGLPSADRLRILVPDSGHLLHMPSHIDLNVGHYHDAVFANQRAVDADRQYVEQGHSPGEAFASYMLHNHHFLWMAAMQSGESQAALQAARHIAAANSTLQHYSVLPLLTLTKFGRWNEILAEPAPGPELKYSLGVWHFARGVAFNSKGQRTTAAQELTHLRAIAADPALKNSPIEGNSATALLQVATHVLTGELAAQRSEYDVAIRELKAAIAIEDTLRRGEMPAWYSPVRQTLGAVLLAANRPVEAEQVYRADLARYRENGWSLLGLAQSLSAQNQPTAAEVEKRFQAAWRHADVSLTASTF